MNKFIVTIIIFLSPVLLIAQDNNVLKFSINPDEDLLNQPVSIDLSGVDYYRDSTFIELYRLDGKKKYLIASQLERDYIDRLWFIPGKYVKKGENAVFEIHRVAGEKSVNVVIANRDPENIQIKSGDKEILSYRHALMEAPAGTDPLYRRYGGYIHPLKSPSGNILTNIQPPDHYHHYGIWNPWTLTYFEGREVDFWNLAKGLGTVKYAGTISTWSGELYGGFKVRHEHIDFSAPGEDKTAMNEIWEVRAWNVNLEKQPIWLIDFVFTLSCATDSLVRLDAYRYGGGIGFRATAEWTSTNSSVLTSEGKTRRDADGSFARWCMITGETGMNHTSGIIFMSHPANRSHPEPMRVWPEDANNGRGDVFFEFCPIRHKPWIFYPGQEYVLRYRLVVFEGTITSETADVLWNNYAYPVKTKILQ
jgi:hypothetical protein